MYTYEKHAKKLFIGLELRTNNQEAPKTIAAHWGRFYKENILAQIPHQINGNVLALYTDYEGDYTKPYSCIIGCEVSSLEDVPVGLVGKEIPASRYAVYTSQGSFPQGLVDVWQTIWKSNMHRSYTTDFELYAADFNPVSNPTVKVYIAIE